jgi:phage tail protein X
LIVGRPRTVHLRADSVSCVEAVMLRDADGRELRADWKPVMPDGLEIVLPLQSVQPGSASMLVSQYGAKPAQPVALRIFAEAGRLDRFTIHSGDTQGLLKGTRLDKVASLSISGIELVPGELSTRQGIDELPLLVKDPASIPSLKQNETAAAQVTLRDGRVLSVPAAVEAPRPRVTLLNKSVQPSRSSIEGNIQLTDPDLLPQDSKLVFSLRAASPPAFAQNASIEVGTADAAAVSTLSLGNGALTLENRQVAVATLEPAKSLGRSSFGPLQFRVLVDGLAGEWQPLATLVRLPQLKELKCPGTADLACKLSGSDLFLLDSVSGNERFENAVKVPDGFLGNALPVPHPESGRLYVRLRDEPAVIISSTLAAQELPSTQDPDRAAVRQSVAAEEAAGK